MRNPRIFVTVDEELADAIRRIGRATDQSQSSVIGSVLDAQRQVLLQLADTLDKARALAMPLSGPLRVSLGEGEDAVGKLAHDAQAQLDQLNLDLDAELERQGIEPPERAPRGDRGGGRSGGEQPPYINKGASTGGRKGAQKPRKGRK